MKANVLLMLVILLVASASCESRSGRRNGVADQLRISAQTLEKVVILDSEITLQGDFAVRYKVKRISKGVVTFISLIKSDGRFEKGDTIFYKF